MRPWLVDPDAVEVAQLMLGLRHPVVIHRRAARGRNGTYLGLIHPRDYRRRALGCKHSVPAHWITLKSNLSPYFASRTAWHEFAHAAQCEAHGPGYLDAYADALREQRAVAGSQGTGTPEAYERYRSIPWEVDAREHEVLADLYPLIRWNPDFTITAGCALPGPDRHRTTLRPAETGDRVHLCCEPCGGTHALLELTSTRGHRLTLMDAPPPDFLNYPTITIQQKGPPCP